MTFRWTRRHVRTLNIPYAIGFNAELNHYKGELNSGIDRDNLPTGPSGVTSPMMVDGALHKWGLQSEMEIDVSMQRHPVAPFVGPSYSQYLGGWHVHLDEEVEEDWLEGTLHCVFNGHVWRNTAYASQGRTWFKFAILFNGAIVHETDRIYGSIHQVHLECVIPVASGSGKVQVAWRANSPIGVEAATADILTWAGGKLVAFNRYR